MRDFVHPKIVWSMVQTQKVRFIIFGGARTRNSASFLVVWWLGSGFPFSLPKRPIWSSTRKNSFKRVEFALPAPFEAYFDRGSCAATSPSHSTWHVIGPPAAATWDYPRVLYCTLGIHPLGIDPIEAHFPDKAVLF